jgi:futalosine hydrolase
LAHPTLLLTATPKEMRAALDGLPGVPRIRTGQAVEWRWQGRSWLLLATGIGPVNAAWCLGRVLGQGRSFQGALNLGIAGSFDLNRFPLGRQVIIKEEIWPEFGLRTEQGLEVKGLGYAHGKVAGRLIWDRIQLDPDDGAEKMGLTLPEGLARGSSLSVSGATGWIAEAERLCRTYSADVENMEGFALAWGCLQEGLPFVEVRSVSNKVGSRSNEDWDFAGAFAALGQAFRRLQQQEIKGAAADT